MAQKRKSRLPRKSDRESKLDQNPSKLVINSWKDVADSEDEFHINQDKILLDEGPARKRQRKLQEEFDFIEPSDEEVLALPEDLSTDDDVSEEEAEDDEVGNAEDVDLDSEPEGDEKQEDEGAWGTTRKDYYNADVIETEADALEEEQEALRLQRKQLEGMTEADFIPEEYEWLQEGKVDGEPDGDLERGVQEVLQPVEITDNTPIDEQNRILATRYPEIGLLSKEFLSLQAQHEKLEEEAVAIEKVFLEEQRTADATLSTPGIITKWRALSAYLGCIAMYFAIMTSGSVNAQGRIPAMPPSELHSHPIMDNLLQTRSQWEKLRDMKFPDYTPVSKISLNGDENPAEEPLLNGRMEEVTRANGVHPKKKRERKSKAQKKAERALADINAQRAERLQKTKSELAEVSAFASKLPLNDHEPAKAKTVNHAQPEDESDFGEPVTKNTTENDRRKKSLAFYTSQIAQKANKRNLASRNAGGDDDIPHKERFRDRQTRLNAEAEARGKKKKDALSINKAQEDSNDEEDRRVAAEVRAAANNEADDYYQEIATQTQQRKADKAARRKAHQEAALRGATVRPVETLSADGKRAITYEIEKNKGLTPKRKKDVRNPRVKKRRKYEDKMKKLGSMRQLYKGGEGRGGYGGEMTGIDASIVRSTRL